MKRIKWIYIISTLFFLVACGGGGGSSGNSLVPSNSKEITDYRFLSVKNPSLSADHVCNIVGTTISVTLPYGIDPNGLIADFASTGQTVEVGSTIQVSGVTANDFTNPASYIVTAADSTAKNYTVTVTIALNSAKDIIDFRFLSVKNPSLSADHVCNIVGTTISVTLPYGIDPNGLIADFASTGQTVEVGSTIQVSGVTANDFTNPVSYIVTAADSTTKNYTVTVTIALNSAKDIIDYRFLSVKNPSLPLDYVCTIVGTSISVTLPYGTNLNGLIANFTSTGQTVAIGSTIQVSGVTANDFTNPVSYIVTAADSTTKYYTVTVSIALITAFSFLSTNNSVTLIDDCIGTINGTNISLTVPPLTNVTGLVATFSTTSGSTVMVGSTVQTSDMTVNDFTNPVTYTVTAADSSTTNYTVTVTIQIQVITWTQQTSSGAPGWETATSSDDGIKIAISTDAGVYLSSDAGVTWTQNPSSGAYIGMASSADGLKLAAGLNGGYIYTSTDGGANWTPQTNSGSRSWYGIASSADGTKLAACDHNTGYIYTSTDEGVTWITQTASGARAWSGIASSSDGMRIVACVQNGYIYTSTDGGSTWNEQSSVGAQYWWSCTSSTNGLNLAVIAYGGNMLTSTDGGTTWTNLGNRGWCAISTSADGTKMAACVWGGYVYFSNDSGVTWIQQTSAGYRYWDTIAMSANGNKVVACDYYGNVWTAE